jgi:hypothetical protein
VSVTAVQDARDFGALALRLSDAVQVRGVFEYLADVRISLSFHQENNLTL